MNWRSALGLAGVAAWLGCSSLQGDPAHSGTTDANSDTSDAGSGVRDTASETPPPCALGYALKLEPAVPTDPSRKCVDAERAEAIQTCVGTEFLKVPRYFCYRRRVDGVEFWLMPGRENHPDPSGWEFCNKDASVRDEPKPPRPCFTSGCAARPLAGQPYPYSLCSERKTRELFACGTGDRVWDDNCCLRARCAGSQDCYPDEECRNTFLDNLMYCWLGSTESHSVDIDLCACGGALGGPPGGFCFKKPL